MGQPFQDLSTIEDGSVLYFSSPIRQAGSNQVFYSKIFRWDAAAGIQVAAQVSDPGSSDGCVTTNFYQLRTPQASLDGSVLAYTGSRSLGPLGGSRYCSPSEPNQGVVVRAGQTIRLDGNIALSPIGRYAISTNSSALSSDFHTVNDLTTGLSSVVAGAFNGSSRRVTDDGSVLTTEAGALILTDRMGGTKLLLTKWPVTDAIVDRSGSIVVYTTTLSPTNSSARVSSINVKTGIETEAATGCCTGSPLLSSDGTNIFFIDQGVPAGEQLFVVGIGGGNRRQITSEKDGIVTAAVSGNGLVAYATTSSSRLIRIDVASAAATELVAATPVLTAAYRVFPPQTTVAAVGSVIDLYGSGLASVQRLSLCGRTVAFSLKQAAVRFQVPWDLPEGPCQAIVASGSPFEHALDFNVQQYDPQFVQISAGEPVVVHSAFNGYVSEANPARSGEVIVAYMTGLGPVDGSGLLSGGFACRVDSTPAEVLYAGLAPQLTGFYQVNVRVPAAASITPSLTCGWDATRQASTGLWVTR